MSFLSRQRALFKKRQQELHRQNRKQLKIDLRQARQDRDAAKKQAFRDRHTQKRQKAIDRRQSSRDRAANRRQRARLGLSVAGFSDPQQRLKARLAKEKSFNELFPNGLEGAEPGSSEAERLPQERSGPRRVGLPTVRAPFIPAYSRMLPRRFSTKASKMRGAPFSTKGSKMRRPQALIDRGGGRITRRHAAQRQREIDDLLKRQTNTEETIDEGVGTPSEPSPGGGAPLSNTPATRLHGESLSAGTSGEASRSDHQHAIYNASSVAGLEGTVDGSIGYTRGDDQLWIMSAGSWTPCLRFT